MNNEVKKLSALLMDEDFKELSKAMDVYCPFESLKVARAEIRHSNFLADVLSPLGAHGFGDAILSAFIQEILKNANEDELALNIHLSELSNVEIRREWKNIDLIIRLPQFENKQDVIFIMEIKVEAQESDGQLEKYEKIAENEWQKSKILYFFLDQKEGKSSRENWIDINFGNVINAIEKGLNETNGHQMANMMARNYIDMLKRRYLGNELYESLAENLWRKHREALEYLENNRFSYLEHLKYEIKSNEFLVKTNAKLAKNNPHKITLIHDVHYRSITRFAVLEWDNIQGFNSVQGWTKNRRHILLEISISPQGVILEIVLGRDGKLTNSIWGQFKDDDGFASRPPKKTKDLPQYPRIYRQELLSKNELEKILYFTETLDLDQFLEELTSEISDKLSKVNSKLLELKR